ncbi:hypothetical protein CcI49_23205 [Frankia sp. CcI49]|uniref:hypothetical protein n=1 Tax=Frankia sp. CcI49 TaxID=1745382 RepID=UPI0009C64007|nr:hypothetical protein [Frankia sp. CcI49]ONH58366.1 hypothetical protein CcI49_23205 [Frankia sp. CcI49]
MNDHPFPPGARVYHWRAQQYPEAMRGTATVLGAEPHGGSWEYEIQRDRPLFEGGSNGPTWWASYHTARAVRDFPVLPEDQADEERAGEFAASVREGGLTYPEAVARFYPDSTEG